MYEINLSTQGLEKLKESIKNIEAKLQDEKFINFIAKKSFQLLQEITTQNLNLDELGLYEHSYRTNHQIKIQSNEIDLWNDTMVNLDNLNLSEETKANYSNGLSLAKIVEYGTGIVGARSKASTIAENWEYDVNNHGEQGWFYQDNGGQLHFTSGIEGRLIFYKTKEEIEKQLPIWVNEYVKDLGSE